jgi:hypothetical protein
MVAVSDSDRARLESVEAQTQAIEQASQQDADQRAADTALVMQAFAAIVPDPAAQAALSRILGVPDAG